MGTRTTAVDSKPAPVCVAPSEHLPWRGHWSPAGWTAVSRALGLPGHVRAAIAVGRVGTSRLLADPSDPPAWPGRPGQGLLTRPRQGHLASPKLAAARR